MIHQGGTLGELFVRAVRQHGDRPALADERETISYAELGRRMAGFAAVLQAAGLERGDGIAMITANRADAVVAIGATMLLGLRYTPLHPRGSLDDHAWILEDAGVKVLLIDEIGFAEHGLALCERVPGLRAHYFLGTGAAGPSLAAAMAGTEPPPLANQGQPDDIVSVIYTGGTTGRPKGVVHRHRSLLTNLLTQLAECELPAELNFLAVTPVSHASFLFILPTLLRGGRFVLRRGFSPAEFVELLHTERITATFLVPTMINMILDDGTIHARGPGPLQTLVYGASPIAPSRLQQGLAAFGPVFVQIYGQVEVPNVICVLAKRDHDPRRPGLLASCGQPTPANQVRLLDDSGHEVADGDVGEICVRGPLVMEGYWNRRDETAAAMAGGWLHTGDLARRDAQGYLHIVDRKKDLIITGGFNVYPREVEDVLARHPQVAMCCVVGVPDPRWGEAVKAVVVPAPGAQPDPQQLCDLVADEKGRLCAPKSIDFVAAIPLTPLGKPDRKAVRQQYWSGHERQVS